MEEQIVYKVVQNTSEGYISYLGDDLPDQWIARYELNVWTMPPIEGSRLFAFSDPQMAFRWAEGWPMSVFRARGVGIQPVREVARNWTSSLDLTDFWRSLCVPTLGISPSAVTCERIMLLEEIRDGKSRS